MIDKSLRTTDIQGAQPKSIRGSIDSMSQISPDKIAGVPNYYYHLQPVPYSITDRMMVENSSRSGKRRFFLPQNEIMQANIFQPPQDPTYQQLKEISQIGYNRNLQTDDIQGTKPGTYTNPSLKNLYRGKQIKDYQQWQEYSLRAKNQDSPLDTTPQYAQQQQQQLLEQNKTDLEISQLKSRLNELQQQLGKQPPSLGHSQQLITAQNILSPSSMNQQQQQYRMNEQDQQSQQYLWNKMLSGHRVDTQNVIKFGKGFKQLGYIYKQY